MPAGNIVNDDAVMDLVSAVLSFPVHERTSYINAACAGDGTLKAEVCRRVELEEKLGSFLLVPIFDVHRMDQPFAAGEHVLDRFRIIGLTGEGGMGVVYEAVDERLNLRVALKCPRLEFRRRLGPEARTSLRVNHRNICRVHDILTARVNGAEVDFLTMEFLSGQTLAEFLPTAGPGWTKTDAGRRAVRELCEGLAAIHAENVVHRDLKPSNVMMSTDSSGNPRLVIMDFGISETTDLLSSRPRGTPDFIAPEIWKGQPATARSDVYSFGVMLFQIATMRRPFSVETSWEQRLNGRPDTRDVNAPWRKIVDRCLAPEPAERYVDAREILEDLKAGNTRRKLLLLAGTGTAAAAVAGAAFWYRQPGPPVRLAILPMANPAKADQALIDGFTGDIAYRLKTMKPQRKLAALGPAELAQGGFVDASTDTRTGAQLGATHELATGLRLDSNIWRASANLREIAGPGTWRVEQRGETPAAALLSLQVSVAQLLDQTLNLRADAKPVTLPADVYADYLRGVSSIRANYENPALALPHFERVVHAAPGSALGYAGLAEAYLQQHIASGGADKTLEAKALEAAANAERLDPNLAHVHVIASRLEFRGGFHQRALSEIQRAIELDPSDPESYIRQATYFFLTQRPEEAQASFDAAFRAQPGYYKPYLDAGYMHFEQGDYARAERDWREAARLAPGNIRARLNLGALYERDGRLDAAAAVANEILKFRRLPLALELLGDVRQLSGRHAEAVSPYEEALAQKTTGYTLWASLGRSYAALSRKTDAARAYSQGLESIETRLAARPDDPELAAWSAYYQALLGLPSGAYQRAAQAAGARSLQGNVRKRLALTYGELRDLPAALALLEKASHDLILELAKSPETPEALRQSPQFQALTKK